YAWGYLSDRFGRRPTLLTSLLLVSLCTLAFGFSRSFGFASAVGLVTGLVNGVVIVGKAQIYDISDTSNQSYGIASLSLSWGLGSLIGPMLGGFLAKYRAVPTFPYLVPSIALSAIAGAILLLSCWLLKEPKRAGISIDLDEIEKPVATAAAAPLILVEAPTEGRTGCGGAGPQQAGRWASLADRQAPARRAVAKLKTETRPLSVPLSAQRAAQACRAAAHGGSVSRSVALLAAVSAENCLVLTAAEAPDAAAAEEAAKPADEKSRWQGRTAVSGGECGPATWGGFCSTATQYFLQSMCSVYLNTLVIVWIPTSSYYGGLGFSAQSLATLLSISAVSLFVFQPIVFPLLERRLGATRLFMHTLMLTLVCSATLPLRTMLCTRPLPRSSMYTRTPAARPACWWTLCIALLCLLNQAILTSFSCTALMVNNSVRSSLSAP
uniref:MFS domain-containing protein n=1 Tax=Macrostomum lignano TaxID=282301 RepID=A0A1I8JRY6_9PLAT